MAIADALTLPRDKVPGPMMDKMQLGIFVATMIVLVVYGCIFTRRTTERAAEHREENSNARQIF